MTTIQEAPGGENNTISNGNGLSRIFASLSHLIMGGVLFATRLLFSLFPINRKLIVLEGSKSYDDSTRTLFEEMLCLGLNKKYDFVWVLEHPERFSQLAKLDGVRVVRYVNSWVSLRHLPDLVKLSFFGSRAALHVYSNMPVCFRYTPGQKSMYLSHGIPLKNVRGILGRVNDDYVCATSDFEARLMQEAVGCLPSKMRITGFPRNDDLIRGLPRGSSFLAEYEGMKKIIWMPTFRHLRRHSVVEHARNDLSVDRDNEVPLLTKESMQELNACLRKHNAILIIKYHPLQDMSFVEPYSLSNVRTLTREDLEREGLNFYQALGGFDALITDYSSVGLDWLLLDKPVAYDISDIKEYADGLGFMVDDPLEYMPGDKITTCQDIRDFIEAVCEGVDDWSQKRHAVCDVMHKYQDDNSSKRVLDVLDL